MDTFESGDRVRVVDEKIATAWARAGLDLVGEVIGQTTTKPIKYIVSFRDRTSKVELYMSQLMRE